MTPWEQLEVCWQQLDAVGAAVNRIPAGSPPALIELKLDAELRRLRALQERP